MILNDYNVQLTGFSLKGDLKVAFIYDNPDEVFTFGPPHGV